MKITMNEKINAYGLSWILSSAQVTSEGITLFQWRCLDAPLFAQSSGNTAYTLYAVQFEHGTDFSKYLRRLKDA